MRALFWTSVVLAGLIGVVHSAFTAVAFDRASQDAIYIAGTGLGTIVLAPRDR